MRKTSRPFGVTTEQWAHASREQHKETGETFEGVPPTLDLADNWATMAREERADVRRTLKTAEAESGAKTRDLKAGAHPTYAVG